MSEPGLDQNFFSIMISTEISCRVIAGLFACGSDYYPNNLFCLSFATCV